MTTPDESGESLEGRGPGSGLRDIAEKYYVLFNATSDGLWINNLQGQILEVNDAYCHMSGYSRAELVGMPVSKLEAIESAEEIAAHIRKVVEGGGHDRFESRHRRKDGNIINVEITALYLEREGGRLAIFTRDITERKQAEDALRESEARYRRIIETAQEGIMIADTEGVISFANAKMAEMVGYSVKELIGKPGVSLIDPSDLVAAAESAARIQRRKSGEREHYEAKLLRKDGSELWAHASGAPIYDGDGKHVGNLGMYADITERKRAEEEVESVARFPAENPNPVLRLSKNGVILYANEASRPLLSEDDAASGAAPEFLRKIAERASADNTIITADITRNGTTWSFSVVPIAESGYANLYGRDVTERKRVEEESRLQSTALQAAANGIVITDPEGTIQWVNDAFTHLTGYSAAEAIGQNPRVLKSGKHEQPFYNNLWDTVLSGRVWHGGIINKRKDGSLYTEEMTITPMVEADAIVHFIAIKQDVTARKQAEEALRESERRLTSLAQNVPSVLMRYDRDLRVVYLSKMSEEITSIPVEDFIGKTNREVGMPEDLCTLFENAIEKVFKTGRETSVEFDSPSRDAPRSFYLKLAPEKGPEGDVEHVLGISTDVTDLKRAEAQLERLRSEFYGVISHELKTPLTAIKGSAAMALTGRNFPDTEEARELFEVISDQCDRLTEMVNNLLDMTRIEAGTFSVDTREADLEEIVADALRTLKRAGYAHQVELKLPKKLPVLRADRRRIVQVLTNLLTNAAKYSSPALPIDISAQKDGKRVIVRVSDQGAGMVPEKLPLLFQKFSRPSDTSGKGTGLGLWIADSIVRAHGGRIWAESDGLGQGSTFGFTLPVFGAVEPIEEPLAVSLRVLAVDDEPSILRFVERFLTVAGHQVVTTTDPFAVRGLVEADEPNVLILDMKMPGKSGVEILEEIRQFSQVPVLVITATDNEQEVVRAKSYAGVSWLPKPFGPDELLDHIRAAVRQPRPNKL